MRLLAISDLHRGDPVNRECFDCIGESPDDWLILAGDVGETEAHLALAFGRLRSCFARLGASQSRVVEHRRLSGRFPR
jgi:predicted phosphodiesterase